MKAYLIPEEAEKAFEAYFACFDPESGELIVTEEILTKAYDHMKSIENQKNQMVEWALGIHSNHVISATGLTLESERIAALAASETKKADKMVSLVRMLIGNEVKEKPAVIANWKIGFTKAKGSTVIDDAEKVPDEYKRYNASALTFEQAKEKFDECMKDPKYADNVEEKIPPIKFIVDDGAPDKNVLKAEIEKIEASEEFKNEVAEAKKQYDADYTEALENWKAEHEFDDIAGFFFRPFVQPDAIPGVRIVKEDKFYVKSTLDK